MLTVMGIAARKHGIELAGARARVEKHMVADPARRVGKLSVKIEIPGAPDEHALALLRRAAETCPVHHSLSPRTEIELLLRAAAPARPA
jgi:putative redox protein